MAWPASEGLRLERFLVLLLTGALAAMLGCGFSPIGVSISPATASIATNQTLQLTSTVSSTPYYTAVAWQVNGVANGNSTVGTITVTGTNTATYAAPASVPTTNPVAILAVSQADSTKTASASVTVTGVISISPSAVVVPAGAQQAFTATVSGKSANIIWTLACSGQVAGACGSISSVGVYTAPLSPPPEGKVVLTASTSDVPASPASAAITVNFSNASLKGQYAFSFVAYQVNGSRFKQAGSIAFDGNGNITGGAEDVVAENNAVSSATITGGTYNIGPDGRVTIPAPGGLPLQTSSGPESWRLALVSHSQAFAIRFDGGTVSGGGTLDLQDPTQFNLAAVNGRYSLALSSGPASAFVAGAFVADGGGAITSALLDLNIAEADIQNLTPKGSYTTPAASGRGTLTIVTNIPDIQSTQNFVFYMVDATHLKLLQTDIPSAANFGQPFFYADGDAFKQPAGPFSNASFKSSYVFLFSGRDTPPCFGKRFVEKGIKPMHCGGPLSEFFQSGGILALDGAGNVNGIMDVVGSALQSGGAISGTYSVADPTTGRTTLSMTAGGFPLQFVFYPHAGGLAFVALGPMEGGVAFAQTGSGFSNASFQGHYAADFTYVGDVNIAGQMIPDGVGLFSGALDFNYYGTTSSSIVLPSSSYGMSADGRGTATLQTSVAALSTINFNLYVVDTNTVLFLSTGGLSGMMRKQY